MEPPTRSTDSEARRGQTYRLAWIFYLVLAVGAVVWIGGSTGRIEAGLFFSKGSWFLDLGVGVLVAGAMLALWEGLRRGMPSVNRLEEALADALGPLRVDEALALAALSGFAEELFFRGAVLLAWGWFPATLLFALLHAGPGAAYRAWTAFAAVAGLLFAGLMIWRGNLLAAIVAHTLVNGVNLSRLARREMDEPAKGETEES